VPSDRRSRDSSGALRLMAEMGLSARTRTTVGSTARTLAGSVRDYAAQYRGIVDVAYSAPDSRGSVYLKPHSPLS
jgi:hypothetical protein